MKILIQGTNWIGDAIMSVPAMIRLRQAFPNAEITLHTRRWAEGIFKDAEFFNSVVSYERSGSLFSDALSQSRMLRPNQFDVGVVFPNSFVSAFTACLARIPERFGYATEARRLLLTHPVKVPEWKEHRHEVFYYLNLVDHVIKTMQAENPVEDSLPQSRIKVSPLRREMAGKFLESNGVDIRKKTVALGVGSANSRAKRWPADRYAKLNDHLQRELNANVVLLGASNEMDVANDVINLAKSKPCDLSGKTNLDMATAILSTVDLLISNDMGLAHIAPAVGTNTLVLFGPTDPETTRPYSENATIIRRIVECSPCMLRDCPIDHRCMTQITVEDVFEKARILLTDQKRISTL